MTDTPTPDSLRPGDLMGPWRIEGYSGRGTYGVVYRARRAGHAGASLVALKLAVFTYDPRMVREAELLSRLHHPSVPQVLDRGWWIAGPEAAHPYLVMEWIQGLPLYEWGKEHRPTSRQVLQVLAQVAWGLEVLHRVDGLHRDVKGDNFLVEPEGRAVLMDYGSSTWAGAPPITESLMPPNTREYRSPEALRFEWGNWRKKGARYKAQQADDLYALGVSMYRLVTGVYPPPGTDPEARKACLPAPPLRRISAPALNERVVPELSALIERMLAEEPAARGLARDVAELAETAAEQAGPEADVPLFGVKRSKAQAEAAQDGSALLPGSEQLLVELSDDSWALRSGLIAAALVLGGACLWWTASGLHARAPEVARVEDLDGAVAPDAGTKGLGDSTLTEQGPAQWVPSASGVISLDMPEQPFPGQRRPPCLSGQTLIRRGCWRRLADVEPPCDKANAYEWQGSCYDPSLDQTRPPTSDNPR